MPRILTPDVEMMKQALSNSHDCSKVEKLFNSCLEEMILLYLPQFSADTQEECNKKAVIVLNRYFEALSGYPEEQLARGWKRLVEGYKVKAWPSIAEIRYACDGVAGGGRRSFCGDEFTDAMDRGGFDGRASYWAHAFTHQKDGDQVVIVAKNPFTADHLVKNPNAMAHACWAVYGVGAFEIRGGLRPFKREARGAAA